MQRSAKTTNATTTYIAISVVREIKNRAANKTASQLGTRSIFALLSAPAGEVARLHSSGTIMWKCYEIVLEKKERNGAFVGALLTYCSSYCLVNTLFRSCSYNETYSHFILVFCIVILYYSPLFLLHSLHCAVNFFHEQIFGLPQLYD